MKVYAYYNQFGPDPVKTKLMEFSAGESHAVLNFERSYNITRIVIEGNIVSPKDLMDVVVIKNAVDNYFKAQKVQVDLFTGYMPYSRSDRVCATGEEFGLQAFSTILNALKFDNVYTIDPHSEATNQLVNNLIIVDQTYFIKSIGYVFNNYDFVCAPDKGSSTKVKKVSDLISTPLIQGLKTRNPETGALSGFDIIKPEDDIRKSSVIIVDDICDGGGTFIGLAEKLRKSYGVKNIGLLVSHGIFSKGTDIFKDADIKLFCINDLKGNYTSIAGYDELVKEVLVKTPKTARTIE